MIETFCYQSLELKFRSLSLAFKTGFNRFPCYVWSWKTATTRVPRLETRYWYNLVLLYPTSFKFLTTTDLSKGKRGSRLFWLYKSGLGNSYRVFSLQWSTAESFVIPFIHQIHVFQNWSLDAIRHPLHSDTVRKVMKANPHWAEIHILPFNPEKGNNRMM